MLDKKFGYEMLVTKLYQVLLLKISDKKNGYEMNRIQDEIKRVLGKITERENCFMNDIKIKEYYKKSEYKRANLNELLESELTDINGGHWDVFDDVKGSESVPFVQEENIKVYGRNPENDVEKSAIVAIDFGTKSTVAIYRDNTETVYPLEIGSNSANENYKEKNFENPTMIEFGDFEEFLRLYNAKEGRPYTEWNDLQVSHHAQNDFVNSNKPEVLNSILSDVKQWASGNRKINIKDRRNEYSIKKFLEGSEDDITPVELYAYYIGLNLNNMCNKKIFLRYILSYPVTYEKAIREKIRLCFEKGIKKSLPVTILNNEKIMKKFSVKNFNSEPFCYAATALEQYNFFNKVKDEEVFYGIFDFGGGTTDFDFGIFRKLEGDDRYSYEMESISSDGNKYLGGENILSTLAYETFMSEENIENLRKGNFQIYLPLNEKMPLKNYDMINETKEAKSNLIKIAEGLRFIWENSDMPDNYNDDLGELSINLLDKFSNQTTVNLIVDIDRLKNRIREMIKNGVDVFFANLSSAIKNKMVNEINIFLAGNSSKSEYVKEIFEAKKIEMLDGNEKFNEKVKIFPPLGTEEAEEKQKEMGYVIDRNKFIPNGKTGVAYGSILLRKNGEIKTDISAEEVPFNYIVGRKRKGEFKDILNKEVGYDEWKKYIVANEIENEIYFTDDYSNLLKDSELKNIKTIMIDLDDEYDDDEYIYIRSISPNKIEYCVSNSEKIKKDEYIEEPKEIDLSNE